MSYKYEDMREDELTLILKEYMDPKYWPLNDFSKTIEEATVEDGMVLFKLNQFTIGLDPDTLEFIDVVEINGFTIEE